jgi:hypothetical protein
MMLSKDNTHQDCMAPVNVKPEQNNCEPDDQTAVRATGLKQLLERIESHPNFAAMRNSIQGIQRLLCQNKSDKLITDTTKSAIAQRLPDWYTQMNAQTFLLLPIFSGTNFLGVLYGDASEAGQLVLGKREMELLKVIRNALF